MGWIVSLITSLLGLFLKHKQDVSEQAGENIQALKDEGAAYDELAKAAGARADADTAAVLRQPDADQSNRATAKQQFPGVEFRD